MSKSIIKNILREYDNDGHNVVEIPDTSSRISDDIVRLMDKVNEIYEMYLGKEEIERKAIKAHDALHELRLEISQKNY